MIIQSNQSIDFTQFCKSFDEDGVRNHFSNYAMHAIFDYLEEYQNDTGDIVVLEPSHICNEFLEIKGEETNEGNREKYDIYRSLPNGNLLVFND